MTTKNSKSKSYSAEEVDDAIERAVERALAKQAKGKAKGKAKAEKVRDANYTYVLYVVGNWQWLRFSSTPDDDTLQKLRDMGAGIAVRKSKDKNGVESSVMYRTISTLMIDVAKILDRKPIKVITLDSARDIPTK